MLLKTTMTADVGAEVEMHLLLPM